MSLSDSRRHLLSLRVQRDETMAHYFSLLTRDFAAARALHDEVMELDEKLHAAVVADTH